MENANLIPEIKVGGAEGKEREEGTWVARVKGIWGSKVRKKDRHANKTKNIKNRIQICAQDIHIYIIG